MPDCMHPQFAKPDLPVRQLGGHDTKLAAETGGAQSLDDLQRIEIVAERRDDDRLKRGGRGQVRAKIGTSDLPGPAGGGQTVRTGGIADADDKASRCFGHGFTRTCKFNRSRDVSSPMVRDVRAADRSCLRRPEPHHISGNQTLTRILPAAKHCPHALVTEPVDG